MKEKYFFLVVMGLFSLYLLYVFVRGIIVLTNSDLRKRYSNFSTSFLYALLMVGVGYIIRIVIYWLSILGIDNIDLVHHIVVAVFTLVGVLIISPEMWSYFFKPLKTENERYVVLFWVLNVLLFFYEVESFLKLMF